MTGPQNSSGATPTLSAARAAASDAPADPREEAAVQSEVAPEGRYTCPACPGRFDTVGDKRRHLRRKHGDSR